MNDDFNTPRAIAKLSACETAQELKAQAEILGLLQRNPQEVLESEVSHLPVDL